MSHATLLEGSVPRLGGRARGKVSSCLKKDSKSLINKETGVAVSGPHLGRSLRPARDIFDVSGASGLSFFPHLWWKPRENEPACSPETDRRGWDNSCPHCPEPPGLPSPPGQAPRGCRARPRAHLTPPLSEGGADGNPRSPASGGTGGPETLGFLFHPGERGFDQESRGCWALRAPTRGLASAHPGVTTGPCPRAGPGPLGRTLSLLRGDDAGVRDTGPN